MTVNVTDIRFEHLREPLGVGVARPRLSWIARTSRGGWLQSAYEIEARGERVRVESGDSVLVPWPFASLASRERVAVRVRVEGPDGLSPWSEEVWVEAGLLDPADWSARFTSPGAGSLLRGEFEVGAGVRSARLYATALGLYEAELNGVVVGDHVLAPGWTAYEHRLRYQTFDVTGLLREGANCLGATLGDGWYRGRLGPGGGRALYGDTLALLAQLEISYRDGTVQRFVTGESWLAAPGPLVSADLYDGEEHDARLERPGWSSPGHDVSGWSPAGIVERDLATLVAPTGPPVRRTEFVAPVEVHASAHGTTILDFGQNLVGRLRITVSGERGERVVLRHAEVMQDGELHYETMRSARATDVYTLRGGGPETYEPRFTFRGFRYAEISGPVRPQDVTAVVCHSDLERTGWFTCSDPLVNRLHENVVWSMRGNFVDVPTDCPQRDERLGWTGDLQVFAPTASFLYDSAGLLTGWLADLAAEQREDGLVPYVIPRVPAYSDRAAAAWGDAAVIVPWVLYRRFGDAGVLAEQFGSMRGWVDHLETLAGESRLWDRGFQFGDWLDPAAPPDRPDQSRTYPEIVATAYFARSAELLSRAAGVLGRAEEEARYGELAGQVRRAFQEEYVAASGRLLSDSVTGYALALEFALLPTPVQRRRAALRLRELVRAGGYTIPTGFVGTPLVCDALAETGHLDAAYHLLMQTECPSWLYTVVQGATTIWERWDGLLPDGRVNRGDMTSFNHYALGAVADWLHRTVAGLAPAEPGYRRLAVHPRPGGGLTHASARLRTLYGTAEVSWRIEDGQITVEAVVPANTVAEVTLPGGDRITVGSGGHRWTTAHRDDGAGLAPLTLDSTLGEVADRSGGLGIVTGTIVRHVPELADYLKTSRSTAEQHTTVRQALALLPGNEPILAEIEAAFAGMRR
ncbi:glycoside hydrolase family 78 protein [Streptosporangium sp. NPDC006013]|uniref:glycoside hydrolase family 78 protein n=1 Tax=Streptosporangium sp. NPDC006013 TaxID=3155596 RepID=UPI0033BA5C65